MNGFVAAKPRPGTEKTTETHSAKTIKTFTEKTFTANNPLIGFIIAERDYNTKLVKANLILHFFVR
jgi:hypothetical protein